MYALGSIVDRDRLEFLVQRELLDQRLAQFGVVVHDQDFAGIRRPSGPASARNGVARHRAFGGKRASRFAPAKQASWAVDIPAAPMFQCYFSANAVVLRWTR